MTRARRLQLVSAFCFLGSCLLSNMASSAQQARQSATTSGQMRVEVRDEAGQTLPKASLHVSVWTDDKNFKTNRDYTCDASGTAVIELPQHVEILRIWASKAGQAGMFVNLH